MIIIFLCTAILVASFPNSYAEEIPEWVKNTAGWWATDAISENEFVNAIEFLINNEIIQIKGSSDSGNSQLVPEWVKNTAGWWATDAISENEFVNAIRFMINKNIITVNSSNEYKIASFLLTWDEIVADAKYANDGSLGIKDYFFKNTDRMLTTRVDVEHERYLDQTTFDLLSSGIALYRITGDEVYLQQARLVVKTIEKELLKDGRVFIYKPISETYTNFSNQETLQDIAYLALIDSDKDYTKLIQIIADRMLEEEVVPATQLIYDFVWHDGEPLTTDMYIPYDGAVYLESLLLAYEITGDEKYIEQVKKTLLSIWELRNTDTNLIPSSIDANDLSVKKEFMQQYGAGIFLKLLLHYYYLTDDPEIFSIMEYYTDAIITNFWDGKTWDYRVNSDGTVHSNVIEGNYAKLDDALLLVHDLDPKKFKTIYEYAKLDYDNSFQNKVSVVNDLVIHAVKDDGSKESSESMMQYAFIINQNVGSRLFHETNQIEYLKSLNDFYHSVILNHKWTGGYVYGIDSYTLENTKLGRILNQDAPAMIANKLNLTFMPLDDVEIIWTKIGNYEISEPFITSFDDPGRFNSIDFDYSDKSIFFHTIHNKGQIIFADEIKSVFVDGREYNNYDSQILNTLEGTHSYMVFLK